MNNTDTEKPLRDLKDTQARKALTTLCAEYRQLATQASALETAKRALMADIKSHARRARIVRVRGDRGGLLTRCDGRRTIKKERLLEEGVKMAVIEAATVEGEAYYKVSGDW